MHGCEATHRGGSAPARAAYRTCLSAGCNKQSVSRTTHEVKFPQILSAGPKSNTEYALPGARATASSIGIGWHVRARYKGRQSKRSLQTAASARMRSCESNQKQRGRTRHYPCNIYIYMCICIYISAPSSRHSSNSRSSSLVFSGFLLLILFRTNTNQDSAPKTTSFT